jgi:hypothetical protein
LDDFEKLGFQIDVDPIKIYENLPHYKDGIYHMELMDVSYNQKNVPLNWTSFEFNRLRNEQRRQDRIDQERINSEMEAGTFSDKDEEVQYQKRLDQLARARDRKACKENGTNCTTVVNGTKSFSSMNKKERVIE